MDIPSSKLPGIEERTICYAVDKGVAQIRLARADKHNALTIAMRAELLTAVNAALVDIEVKVICLGAEGRNFGVGADLTEMSIIKKDVRRAVELEIRPLVARLRSAGKPVIAAINGTCAGMSIGVALAADMVVMAEDARLMLPFAQLSLIPDSGVSWHLVHALGYRRACELALEGGEIDAQRCLELGLVNRVVAADALWTESLAWAESLALRNVEFLAGAKQVIGRAVSLDLDQAIAMEGELQQACITVASFDDALTRFFGDADRSSESNSGTK